MSASQYGTSLLSEVQEESLDHLLRDLRQWLTPYPLYQLGFFELDRLIEASTPTILQQAQPTRGLPDHDDDDENDLPVETASEDHDLALPSRVNTVIKPSIIEITSTATKTGKTSLLYLLAAIAILPHEYHGNESIIVWLDTESSFSATRLYHICLSQLSMSSTTIDASTRHRVAKDALKHVHVFSVQSSKQLLEVLASLPAYLLQPHDHDQPSSAVPLHHSSNHPLSLLILDSAQAFQHLDRFDAEIARLEAIGTSQPHPPDALSNTTQIMTHLKSLQTQFECSVFYTTTTPIPQSSQIPQMVPVSPTVITSTSNPLTPNRPNISSSTSISTSALSTWTTNATLSLSLSRVPVPQFEAHMSIAECLRDRKDRADVVKKGRIRVDLNEVWLSKAVRDRAVKDKLRGMENRGWVMKLAEGNVEIER